jgi:hypothetical protein
MALILADRVKESTTTTGTSDFALGGAITGFQTFSVSVGANNTTYYSVADGADWEVGLGTLSNDGLTLARTTVLQSSNADAKVSFAAGTKEVFVTYPADKAVSDITSTDASIVVSRNGSIFDLAVSEASPASTLLAAVRNTTGATLTKGTAVYISGSTGQNSTVSKALATGDSTSAQTLGLITSDLANNSNGYVTVIGLVINIDTSAYTDGQQLYLSPTTAGTLTATKPYAPNHMVYVAIVERAHPSQGKLFVKVQNGYEMDELHNVSAQSPTTGQTLVYNASTSLWEKNTVSLTAGVNGTLPVANGGTGITSLGTGVATFLGTPSSANLLAAVTDETGTGSLVFATSPTLVTPALGTPSSVTLTNATGLPNAGLVNSSITIGGTAIALGASSNALANDITVQGVTVGRGGGGVSTNTAVGVSAISTSNTGPYLTAVGYQALTAYSGSIGYNTAIGGNALLALTTGYNNVAVGQSTLTTATSAVGNVAIGDSSLNFNTANYNSALGYGALYTNSSGASNVAVGKEALYSNSTASNNTAVGNQTFYNNTTGTSNTAIGYQAGYYNTTGGNNTAIGYQAFISNTGAYSNIAIGVRALDAFNVTTATSTYNVAIGEDSLGATTTGTTNTAVGALSLYSNTTASNNTAVGYQAAYSNTVGTGIDAFGYQAAYFVTGNYGTFVGTNAGRGVSGASTGEYNTAVGRSALNLFTSGAANTAVGVVALGANSSGSYNSAFGFGALQANTTASDNTAIGYQAGYSNLQSFNVFVGTQAGYSNATNGGVTAVGYQAGYANGATASGDQGTYLGYRAGYNTSGNYNVAVGGSALLNNTTASSNTAVGYQAGYTNQTGTFNTFVGETAGLLNVSGSYCTYIGRAAGISTTGSSNTFVGHVAGYNATTGSGNTFVGSNSVTGYGAGFAMTTGSDNTILGGYNGNQGGLDIRTASNYIVLSDGDGNPKLQIDNTSGGNIFWLGERLENSSSNNMVINNGGSIRINIDCDNNNTGESFTVGTNQRSIDNNNKLFEVLESGTVVLPFGQIQFPATQNASSNANTLDDYEEGLFTATVAPSTSGTITLYSVVDRLAYTKIGRVVYVQGLLEVASVASAVGTAVQIGNLPFTTADLDEYAGRGGTAFSVKAAVRAVNIYENQNVVEVVIDASTLATGDQFYVSFNYIAA